ncbi:MAG: phosphatase PAP2 family protein [Muribaculaceae bacterium]|nr:phosphatase PAP2 family protein [Muribaculaceae bacterium]
MSINVASYWKTTHNIVFVILVCLLYVVFGGLPIYSQGDTESFHFTKAQKGVGISTDVAVIALPVATLAGVLIEHEWEGLKQGALSGVTMLGATYILKYAVKEERPDHSNRHSFPSGHTGTSFATATFLQRRYGWKLGVPAYVVATYVGWGRIYAKKHHWWDVLAGAAIGAGASLIYTRPLAKKHELVFEPSASPVGVNFSASFVF